MYSVNNILHKDQLWTFSGLDKHGKPFSLETVLPMDSADTLLCAGLIPDPYYAQQELDCKWIGEREWKLATTLSLDAALIEASHNGRQHILLDISWLDTHASIFINGEKITETHNMFSRYILDICAQMGKYFNKTSIDNTSLHIEILLHRVDLLAKKRAERLPFPIPSSMGSNNTIPHMNLVRKVQCHAGWDWGITLMVSGVYEAPKLLVCKNAVLLYVTHQQTFLPNNIVELTIHAHISCLTQGTVQVHFSLEGEKPATVTQTLPEGEHCLSHTIVLDNPTLWYPRGYGEAHLYALTVEVDGQTLLQKIGIRELYWLNTEDSRGKSLTLVVNSKEIFCKGANWIPCDAMPMRQEKKYRQLLMDAVAVNMNMLRVWGGGQYERDKFYELCDELGIVIWQDMMFACSLYPSEPWFIEEVQSEIAHQIRRISHHPCIALYCGDNEVIGALNWYEESKQFAQRYTVNYDRLNRAIAETIAHLDPSRQFWPSSPSDGAIDFGNNWHDDHRGDMHYWDVWHAGKSFDAYYSVQPRFCSEFGFQSFPSLSTITTFTDASQYNITSPDMEHHQKNARGNSIILEMFSRYFRIPNSFAQQVYLSQLQQAFAISLGIEYWRSTMPTCMGTLYWQLHDNWPVSSWSSIEYTGAWKQLHYHIARVYKPILITARLHALQEQVIISGINEQHTSTVQIEGGFYDFEGTCIQDISASYTLAENTSTILDEHNLSSIGFAKHEAFLYIRYYKIKDKANRTYLGEKCLFLCEPKRYNFPKVALEYTSKIEKSTTSADNAIPQSDLAHHSYNHQTTYTLSLKSNKPIFYIFIENKKILGSYSDNSFILMPNQQKTVSFVARHASSYEEEAMPSDLVAQSFNCYYLNSDK